MTSLRSAVVSYSAIVGANPEMVQGAGGNASWKEDDVLWVKASGTWLADALRKDIFVPVDLADLRMNISSKKFDAKPRMVGNSTLRPSIETMLHALMPQRVVMHTHLVDGLAFLVRKNSQEQLQEKLAGKVEWLFIPYCKPGAPLAAEISSVIQNYAAPVLMLENHGVIVGGDSVEDVERIYNQLLQLLAIKPRELGAHALPASNELTALGYMAVPDIQELAFDTLCLSQMQSQWALYPDHVVYLGATAPFFTSVQALVDVCKSGTVAELAIIPHHGVWVQDTFQENKKAMLRCYYDVLARQTAEDELQALSNSEIAELLDWDAEKYRQKIAK